MWNWVTAVLLAVTKWNQYQGGLLPSTWPLIEVNGPSAAWLLVPRNVLLFSPHAWINCLIAHIYIIITHRLPCSALMEVLCRQGGKSRRRDIHSAQTLHRPMSSVGNRADSQVRPFSRGLDSRRQRWLTTPVIVCDCRAVRFFRFFCVMRGRQLKPGDPWSR